MTGSDPQARGTALRSHLHGGFQRLGNWAALRDCRDPQRFFGSFKPIWWGKMGRSNDVKWCQMMSFSSFFASFPDFPDCFHLFSAFYHIVFHRFRAQKLCSCCFVPIFFLPSFFLCSRRFFSVLWFVLAHGSYGSYGSLASRWWN